MTKSYTVKGATILHNKTPYGIGSKIELTDNEAAKLVDYVTEVKIKPQTATSISTPKTNKKADTKTEVDTKTSTKNKSSKRSEKVETPAETKEVDVDKPADSLKTDNTSKESEKISDASKEENLNGSETIQTPAD